MRFSILFGLLFLASTQALAIATCETKSLKDFVNDHLNPIIDNYNCREIKTGDHKIVNRYDFIKHNTWAPQQYKLMRLSKKEYEVTIPLKLKQAEGQNESIEKMEAHAKDCVEKYRNSILTKNGEKILLNISFDQKDHRQFSDPALEILVGGTGRSDAGNWKSDISCNTIIHELFHRLGLVDTYSGKNDGYYCRPVGRAKTIMASAHDSFVHEEVVDLKWELDTVYCKCALPKEVSGTDVQNCFNSCPSTMEQKSFSNYLPKAGNSHFKNEKENLLYVAKSFSNTPNAKINLEDAEFRAIIYPNCFKKNKTYLACMRASYNEHACPLPPECQGTDWLD